MSSNKFKELLDKRKSEYITWDKVFCKSLNKDVRFNMRGFNHLRFKTDNTPRHPKEAMYKMGLLPLVPTVIKLANKVDRYEKRSAPVGGTRTKVVKEIEYWSLIATVGQQKVKIKVIIRRIGDGKLHFWSVMKVPSK